MQRYRCCFASRLWEECYSIQCSIWYRENSSIVIVVTPLNLYKTEPGLIFVWIDMQIFRNFHLNLSFFSPNPLLNKFMIRTCCICWSHDRKCSSNMACTYFRVLFLACDGRKRGDPNGDFEDLFVYPDNMLSSYQKADITNFDSVLLKNISYSYVFYRAYVILSPVYKYHWVFALCCWHICI